MAMPRIPRFSFTLPSYRKLSMHPLWNLWLLTAGAAFIAYGVQAVASQHGFLTGGALGLGLLIQYRTGLLSAPVWNLLINLPLLLFNWYHVSKRFVLYTLYGTFAIFAWGQVMNHVSAPVQNSLYAAILTGVLVGTGSGIMLRSLGSSGGTDLVGVYLNQKWNIPVGRVSLAFNAVLFLGSISTISLDLVMVSLIEVFIAANTTDYVVRLFNQRKMVFIVTGKGQEICNAILDNAGRATILPAYGGYSHEPKEVVMTITNNFALRYLEDMVYSIDPHALFAVENTFYVTGSQYPRKKR